MKAEAIIELLHRLGCHDVREGKRYVQSSCPFAAWTHGGADTHPSFGVQIVDGESTFNCLGGKCRKRGGMQWLLTHLEALGGKADWSGLRAFVTRHDTPSAEAVVERLARVVSGEVAAVKGGARPWTAVAPKVVAPATSVFLPESDLQTFEPLPDDALERFPVLAKRQIELATLRRWNVLWHPGARRLGLPVRDYDLRLVGISGRTAFDGFCTFCMGPIVERVVEVKHREGAMIAPGAPAKTKKVKLCERCGRRAGPKYLHSEGFRRDAVLFGEHLIPPGRPEVGLSEGHFDAMAVSEADKPGTAAMGSSLSPEQVAILVKRASGVVIMPDGDEAGMKIAKAYHAALAPWLPVRIAEMPDGKDPDEIPVAERRQRMKDAR